jgi:hypothetical protein
MHKKKKVTLHSEAQIHVEGPCTGELRILEVAGIDCVWLGKLYAIPQNQRLHFVDVLLVSLLVVLCFFVPLHRLGVRGVTETQMSFECFPWTTEEDSPDMDEHIPQRLVRIAAQGLHKSLREA